MLSFTHRVKKIKSAADEIVNIDASCEQGLTPVKTVPSPILRMWAVTMLGEKNLMLSLQ